MRSCSVTQQTRLYKQSCQVLWLYLALWLAAFSPLTCYRHGFLPALHAAEPVQAIQDFPFIVDDMCGTDITPAAAPSAEREPHRLAHKILLLSALGCWLPAPIALSAPSQLVSHLSLPEAHWHTAHLPLPKLPPR